MHRRLFVLTLVSSLVACGPPQSGESPGKGGRDDTLSADFWGFADRRCFTYTDKDGRDSYTVEALADDTTIAGVETWRVVHRHNGFLQREDSFELVGRTLVLWRRKVTTPTGERLGRFDPPFVFLRDNLKTGDSVESTSEASVNEGGNRTDENQVFRTSALDEEPVVGPAGEVQARKLTFAHEMTGALEIEIGWFVPNLGFVKLDPPGEEIVKGEVRLTKVADLADGETCP